MQQVIRRKVIVESKGRIQIQAPDLRKGTTAEVLIIVESARPSDEETAGELRESIATYAAKHAGTAADLDSELEKASVEFLNDQQKGNDK